MLVQTSLQRESATAVIARTRPFLRACVFLLMVSHFVFELACERALTTNKSQASVDFCMPVTGIGAAVCTAAYVTFEWFVRMGGSVMTV